MKLLGGKNSASFAASFSNNGQKISSKAQNERWMGTNRRSICANYIFERIVKNPLETPEIWQKIPWKTLETNFISLLATLTIFAGE